MTWKPDTRPLSGADIRRARMSMPLTDDERARLTRLHTKHPTQPEMAARLGVTPRTYYRYESKGARGTRAALLRLYFEEGEDVSNTDAPLLYWEQLAHYCGSYEAALTFLGMAISPRTSDQWEELGVVRSRVGAGRLLMICWDRLDLESVEPVHRSGMKMPGRIIKQIEQMARLNTPATEIARALNISVTSARKYSKKRIKR